MTTVSKRPEAPVAVSEPTTGLRKVLTDRSRSPLRQYTDLAVGRPGLLALLRYELLTGLLGPIPGALGLFLRQKAYRRMLGACGRGAVIGRNVTLRHPHRIRLGDGVVIDDNAVLDAKGEAAVAIDIGSDAIVGRNSILSCKGGTIRLGERANISVNCTLISESTLTLGDRVLVAGHCYLIAGGNHGTARCDVPVIDQPRIQRGGIRIGDNAWLGAQVTVLDGVQIGHDAVIAAGAVTTRDVPAFGVAAGVPARLLYDRRERTSPDASAPSGHP